MQSKINELMALGVSEQGAREMLEAAGFDPKRENTKKMMPVETYSRVVGYFRPVQQWNKGKQEEFGDRKVFIVPSLNDTTETAGEHEHSDDMGACTVNV
jgi:hypothetical protein